MQVIPTLRSPLSKRPQRACETCAVLSLPPHQSRPVRLQSLKVATIRERGDENEFAEFHRNSATWRLMWETLESLPCDASKHQMRQELLNWDRYDVRTRRALLTRVNQYMSGYGTPDAVHRFLTLLSRTRPRATASIGWGLGIAIVTLLFAVIALEASHLEGFSSVTKAIWLVAVPLYMGTTTYWIISRCSYFCWFQETIIPSAYRVGLDPSLLLSLLASPRLLPAGMGALSFHRDLLRKAMRKGSSVDVSHCSNQNESRVA